MAAALAPHGGQPVMTRGVPLAEARAAVIMVHGRGAGPANILDIVPTIEQPGVAFLAPAAAGGSWYPKGFMSPIADNEPGITSGIGVVHALIDHALDAGIATDHIVLLGFSQGACLSSTAAQRRPARYAGVIVYSGGLIGPPGTTWAEAGDFAGTPAFFGCSNVDGHIPEERVLASAALYERMGATVTTRIYPWMGHLVNDDELAFTRALFEELVSR